MIEAVIFDVDDTLILTGDKTIYGLLEVSKKLKMRVPEREEVARLLGLPWETMVKTLWPEVDIEDFVRSYVKYKTTRMPLECVPGAKEAIENMQEDGYTLGIITSRNKDTLDKVMTKCGLDLGAFDYVECNDQNRYSKPDPRVFNNLKKYLHEKGTTEKETVYVGDAIYDYQAASGAGLHFIAFLNGAYSKKEFVDAGLDKEQTIKKLTDLSGVVSKLKEKVGV